MASIKDGKTIRLGLKSIALSKQSYNGPRQGHQSPPSRARVCFPLLYFQLAELLLILSWVTDRNPNHGQCGSSGDPNSRPLRWFRRHFSSSQPLEASGWPTSQWVDSVSSVSGTAWSFHTHSWISLSPVSFDFDFDLFFVMFTFSESCYICVCVCVCVCFFFFVE